MGARVGVYVDRLPGGRCSESSRSVTPVAQRVSCPVDSKLAYLPGAGPQAPAMHEARNCLAQPCC